MSDTIKVREPNKVFDLHVPDNIADVYVDGMGYAMLGYPMTKVLFHIVLPPRDDAKGVEQRQAVLRVTMTTSALMEFCKNMLSTIEANKTQMLAAKGQFDAAYLGLQSQLLAYSAQPVGAADPVAGKTTKK